MKLNHRGFSLLEITIAMGLLGVVGLGVMKLNQQTSKITKRIGHQETIRDITGLARSVINDPDLCQQQLQALGINSSSNPSISELKNSSGATLIEVAPELGPATSRSDFGKGTSGHIRVYDMKAEKDGDTAVKINLYLIKSPSIPQDQYSKTAHGTQKIIKSVRIPAEFDGSGQFLACRTDQTVIAETASESSCEKLGGTTNSSGDTCEGLTIYGQGKNPANDALILKGKIIAEQESEFVGASSFIGNTIFQGEMKGKKISLEKDLMGGKMRFEINDTFQLQYGKIDSSNNFVPYLRLDQDNFRLTSSYTAIGVNSLSAGKNSLAIGKDSIATGVDSISIGNGSKATAGKNPGGNTAIGPQSEATGKDALAIGSRSFAKNAGTSLGEESYSTGPGSIAIGAKASSTAPVGYYGGIAIGPSAQSTANESLALGAQSKATANSAISLGFGSIVNTPLSMAIGPVARGGASNSVTIKSGSTGNSEFAAENEILFAPAISSRVRIHGKLEVKTAITVNGVSNIANLSDRRLKKNIKTIEDPISKTKSLTGVSYDWINGRKDSAGVIAQDVQKVMPGLIHYDNDGHMAVEYNGLIGLLVESVKAQQKQIDELKTEIKELKEKKNNDSPN